LMKVKEENEKSGLKLNIQKMKIMASLLFPTHSTLILLSPTLLMQCLWLE